MNQPLVSVVVPTRQSAATLGACLSSIISQTYSNLELIVVDNNSTDATKEIAHVFTGQVYNRGPERSAQRNYGVQHARGDLVMIIDSDMVLTSRVVAACVAEFTRQPGLAGVVIPEESFGRGFWAQCKRLERSFYVGVPWMEAARCFPRQDYLRLGGYDEQLVSGEDWDLSQRAAQHGPLSRVDQYIRHNEGRLKLAGLLRKKYYYAQKFAGYMAKRDMVGSTQTRNQTGIMARYKLFLAHPSRLFRHPLQGLGMLFMKTSEFAVGGFGYILARKGAH
jgi:glycosyltransferase involved in cell wall biosynthesis